MKEAADILSQSPCAMQLRYLQTLNNIATEQNSTIIFPIPIDFFSFFQKSQSVSNPFVNHPSATSVKTNNNNITTTETMISTPLATDI